MKFIAFTTKGLEEIARDEIIATLADTKKLEIGPKRIAFDSGLDKKLLSLRTVDDIGLLVAHFRATSLEEVVMGVLKIDFNKAKAVLAEWRTLDGTFSLTVGLVGVKDSTTEDIIQKVQDNISDKYKWTFTEKEHKNFDIRIFVDHSEVYVSVRLTKEPLGKRDYKKLSKKGSLKATVAAGIVLAVTDNEQGLEVLDSFCGSGTILCEAFINGNEIYGGDTDPESVKITKENLKNLGYKSLENIRQMDATKTNWSSGYFDVAVSNLPWNKQIKVNSITGLYEGSIKEFARVLKLNGSLCLLVSKPELAVKYVKKYFPNNSIKAYKIGLLGQTPTIVIAKK
jgi:23S rRNA G2445 N2-methylase RlmL